MIIANCGHPLGIDKGVIGAAVLSHGHTGHAGGNIFQHAGIPSTGELEQAAGHLENSPESCRLLDRIFYLSGEIPRTTSSGKGIPIHFRRHAADTDWGLKKFNLEAIVPDNCTGWRTVHCMLNTFAEEVDLASAAGRRHLF